MHQSKLRLIRPKVGTQLHLMAALGPLAVYTRHTEVMQDAFNAIKMPTDVHIHHSSVPAC